MAGAPDQPLPSRGSSVAEAVPLVGRTAELQDDESLADRIRELTADEPRISEKRMFGGLAFLVNGNWL